VRLDREAIKASGTKARISGKVFLLGVQRNVSPMKVSYERNNLKAAEESLLHSSFIHWNYNALVDWIE